MGGDHQKWEVYDIAIPTLPTKHTTSCVLTSGPGDTRIHLTEWVGKHPRDWLEIVLYKERGCRSQTFNGGTAQNLKSHL